MKIEIEKTGCFPWWGVANVREENGILLAVRVAVTRRSALRQARKVVRAHRNKEIIDA